MEKMPSKKENNEHWSHGLGETVATIEHEMQEHGTESVVNNPREYRISKSVTPQALQALAQLPFEVMLTQHNAGLTMVTGQEGCAIPQIDGKVDRHTNNRTLNEARFTLHNHPSKMGGSAHPSVGDILASFFAKSDIDLVIGEQGMAIHKTDNLFDPIRAKFHVFKYAIGSYSDDDVTKHQLKTKMLKEHLSWEDPRLVHVCDYINGNISWDECEKYLKNKV